LGSISSHYEKERLSNFCQTEPVEVRSYSSYPLQVLSPKSVFVSLTKASFGRCGKATKTTFWSSGLSSTIWASAKSSNQKADFRKINTSFQNSLFVNQHSTFLK